jgi:hypothetical protein
MIHEFVRMCESVSMAQTVCLLYFAVKWLREHALDIPLRNEGLRKAGVKEE